MHQLFVSTHAWFPRRRGWIACVSVLIFIVQAVGCVPSVDSDLPYPADFAATIRVSVPDDPHRSMRVVLEPDGWLRAAIGPDAPASVDQPPRTVRLTDQAISQIYGYFLALPQAEAPRTNPADGVAEVAITYFAEGQAQFAAADPWPDSPAASALVDQLAQAVGLSASED